MAVLRKLSAIYIAAASTYAVVIALAHHPVWAAGARIAAHYTAEKCEDAAIAFNEQVLKPGYTAARAETVRAYRALIEVMNGPPAHVAARKSAPRPARHEIAKAAPIAKPPMLHRHGETAWSYPVAKTPQPSVTLDIAPPKLPPSTDHPPTLAELARVEQRLKDNLTGEMLANFNLFLYVSKAEKGPLAQRMYVFAKKPSGDLVLRDDWPVSTGREKTEVSPAGHMVFSETPQGYYELDPGRFYRHYTSIQWHQPMPYAMFFNWVHDGDQTGLAIHAAHGEDVARLGQRASAGCIRLAPQNAAILFDLIRTQYDGEVPRFGYDRKTETMSSAGEFLHDREGRLRYAKGYKVLVVIENYGGENVIAALM